MSWPPVLFVWIQQVWLFWMNNRFTCLVKSKPVKPFIDNDLYVCVFFPISLCVCLIYSYLYVFVYFTAISMHVCFYSNLYGLFARNFEEWMVLVLSDCVRWSGKTSSLTKIVFGITSFARQKFKPNGPLHLRGPNVIEFGEILPLW